MGRGLKRLLFVHPEDFSSVMGHAEPHYVFAHLSSRFHAQRFPPMGRGRAAKIIPFFLLFNLFSLLKLPLYLRTPSFDLVYSYKSAILLPLFLKALQRAIWVYDLQTHPISQSPRQWKGMGLRAIPVRSSDALKRALNSLALRHSDLVITVSKELRARLLDDFPVSPGKVHVVPLGVDLELFQAEDSPPSCPPGSLNLAYVSSISLQRGHQTCIRAAKILKQRGIPFSMEFFGSGPKRDLEALERMTREEGVEQEVSWGGFVRHQELPRHLSRFHVGLSPLPDIEAYRVSSPTKVFEYMAMGLAIVASDIAAHREFLTHGKNALLFRPEDPEDLAQAIQMLYERSDLRQGLGAAAREESRRHGWDAILAALDVQIERLFSARETGRT
jgi:glycosyltransferase involved in cell wall biosynthesis